MGNRLFVVTVVLLWLITMSWLLVAKILPPLDQGLPPSYRGLRTGTVAGWQIHWNHRPLGWAATSVVEGSHKTKEIHGRVVLDQVPLKDLAPSLMASLVEKVGSIQLDAKSRIEIDPLGNMSSFETRLAVNEFPAIRMHGRIQNEQLSLRIRTGDVAHQERRYLPEGVRLGNELTPDGRMPGMYQGRKWKMQVFSPFRPPTDPVELIEAEVVATELIQIRGRTESTRRVEYRRLDSAGVAAGNEIRAVVWVAEDGTVLRQEVNLLNANVRFDRLDDDETRSLAGKLLDKTTLPAADALSPSFNASSERSWD